MFGDAQQILKGPSGSSEATTPKIASLTALPPKKTPTPRERPYGAKKPEGVSRELYNLVGKDLTSVIPTDMRKSYRNPKLQASFRNVRKYKWMPFTNEARNDGLQLHHWQRFDRIDANQPYAFARFNKVIDIPTYTDEEYDNNLKCAKWNREETDYLFELCRNYDIRWPIVMDRCDMKKIGASRSMEDLKDRFYGILHELAILRDPSATPIAFDAEHEKRRKEQLSKQWSRTKEQLQEEEDLTMELRRIEIRKKEREKKAHDLQKLINMTEQPASPTAGPSGSIAAKRKNAFRLKTGSVSTSVSTFNPLDLSVTALRFSEFKSSGAHLRSAEMKLPTNIGAKKLKNIEVVIEKCSLEMNPIASEEIMKTYNDFRSQVVILQELKSALQNAELQLESVRVSMQQIGRDIEIEPKFRISNLVEGGLDDNSVGGNGNAQTNRRIASYIDVNIKDLAAIASRKRKLPAVVTPSTSADPKRSRKL